MKFTISKNQLLKACNVLSKNITKSTFPLFDLIIFKINGEELSLETNSVYGNAKTKLKVYFSENKDIEFGVNGKIILDALKSLPEQPIEFNIDASLNIRINYNGGKYELKGVECKNLLNFEKEDFTDLFSISAKEFYSKIENIATFASKDDLRPVMMGVLLDAKEDHLNIVATNGIVLGKLHIKGEMKKEGQFIVYSDAFNLIKNVLSISSSDVAISISDSKVRLVTEEFSLILTLLTDKYPNYRAIIPNYQNYIQFNVQEFLSALNRVRVFESPGCAIRLGITNSQINLYLEDPTLARNATETISSYTNTKEDIELKFSPLFLHNILTSLSCNEMSVLEYNTENRPGVFRPFLGSNDLYLIMPIF